MLLTQNVDRLNQAAGSREVIDLHGRLDQVRCLACTTALRRADFQDDLASLNAAWTDLEAAALLYGETPSSTIRTSRVSWSLIPDLWWNHEARRRVLRRKCAARPMENLEQADAMLVVGSSLMVYSDFRFVQADARIDIPIAAFNLSRTRADDLLVLKVEDRCERALAFLL